MLVHCQVISVASLISICERVFTTLRTRTIYKSTPWPVRPTRAYTRSCVIHTDLHCHSKAWDCTLKLCSCGFWKKKKMPNFWYKFHRKQSNLDTQLIFYRCNGIHCTCFRMQIPYNMLNPMVKICSFVLNIIFNISYISYPLLYHALYHYMLGAIILKFRV